MVRLRRSGPPGGGGSRWARPCGDPARPTQRAGGPRSHGAVGRKAGRGRLRQQPSFPSTAMREWRVPRDPQASQGFASVAHDASKRNSRGRAELAHQTARRPRRRSVTTVEDVVITSHTISPSPPCARAIYRDVDHLATLEPTRLAVRELSTKGHQSALSLRGSHRRGHGRTSRWRNAPAGEAWRETPGPRCAHHCESDDCISRMRGRGPQHPYAVLLMTSLRRPGLKRLEHEPAEAKPDREGQISDGQETHPDSRLSRFRLALHQP